ncbi:hypothetical protein [Streptomyces sp. NPDC012616]|uniref:hypothetical protein n=1 Tax=Streptomyces sp. NPDC012616 TaxID=3364840 RepID=UPI0036EE44A7
MPRPLGKQPLPPYKPSEKVRAAIKEWQRAVQLEEDTRHAARAAIAWELKNDPDLPYAAVAAHDAIPWTDETLRGIGREYGVPPRQPNKAKPKE